jgi:hypothetical protein
VLGSSLVSWKSKKPPIISRYFSEAEYRALTQATCDAQWLLTLIRDFEISQKEHDYCDNKSAMHIAAKPIQFFTNVINTLRWIAMLFVTIFKLEFCTFYQFLQRTKWQIYAPKLFILSLILGLSKLDLLLF